MFSQSLQCQSLLPFSVAMNNPWPVLRRRFQMNRVGTEDISLGMSLEWTIWSRREGNASLFSMRSGPDSLARVPRRQEVITTFQMCKLNPNFLSKLILLSSDQLREAGGIQTQMPACIPVPLTAFLRGAVVCRLGFYFNFGICTRPLCMYTYVCT